jgi:hypothetical protein
MSYTQMVVTVVVVTENVCMSRHWKFELVTYGIRIQTSSRLMYLLPLKPNHLLVCPVYPGSLRHPVLPSKPRNYQIMHQNIYPTRSEHEAKEMAHVDQRL